MINHENIKKINQHLFENIETWLPDVKKTSQGYQACNPVRGDKNPSSMTIYQDGRAYDFAESKSYDCINLWAAQNNMSNSDAIKYHLEKIGIINEPTLLSYHHKTKFSIVKKHKIKKEILNLKEPNVFAHHRYDTPSFIYPYYDISHNLIGYTCRFETNDGKVVLPFTWSNIQGKNKDGSLKYGSDNWRWNAHGWSDKWPIYGLEKIQTKKEATTILICEGEKTADAAQKLLPNYIVLSWAGGVNKAGKVDWTEIISINPNLSIFIWPDADIKKDKITNDFLPKHEQPGMKAALQIASLLKNYDPKIVLPPQGVSDGWDLADAATEGWTGEKVLDYIARSSLKPEDIIGTVPNQKKETQSEKSTFIFESETISLFNEQFPNVAVIKYKAKSGGVKYSIDVPKTVEKYIQTYIQDKFYNKLDSEKIKSDLKAKKQLQTRTYKSILTQIWCDCDSVIKRSATRESIENHFNNIMEKKKEESLEKITNKIVWDGTDIDSAVKTISIWIAHALSESKEITDDDLEIYKPQALAIMHFIWQVKRKLFGFQAEMHMAPVLLGDQGNGKSEFIRNLSKVIAAPFGSFVRDAYVDEIGEEKNEIILASSFINILDEMAGAAKAELNKVKNFITRHTVNPREFHSQKTMGEMANLSTFICAANANQLSEILQDESGNRRFFPIKVSSFIERPFSYKGDFTDYVMEKLSWIKNDNECFPYYFDATPIWKMINHEWECFIRNTDVTKIQNEHRYEPVKQWLENVNAEIIDEATYKELNKSPNDSNHDVTLFSVGLVREIFLSMFKITPTEIKKWSIQKFSLDLQKAGIRTWKHTERGKYHKYMVCALKIDWSQIDQRFKDRLRE